MCKGSCMNEVNQTVKARCHEMWNLIKAYTGGKIRFDGLVRGLENGINGMIDFAEAEWLDEVRSIWLQLEIIYALVLDEDRAVTTGEQRMIDKTLQKMAAMLSPYD
jgi:hypothetical protein